MKRTLTFLILLTVGTIVSQNDINWDGKYKLQLSDFQSQSTQIGDVTIYSLSTSGDFDFSFYMSNLEFAFTKNFNA